MTKLIYNIGIYLLEIFCFILSIFSRKQRLLLKGQKNSWQILKQINPCRKTMWIHCASLGEFEQARPLIEQFKDTYDNYQIVLTFFSPSGYEVRKNYDKADFVCYLPFDTYYKAKKFILAIKPDIVFFVKYEFWFNYIRLLHDVPLYSISLILRDNHYLLKSYSKWFIKQLSNFDCFFVQDSHTKDTLYNKGFKNIVLSGDTRADRVIQMSKAKKDFPLIDEFIDNKKILLCGSSWPEDEKIIVSCWNNELSNNRNIKLIIAPHLVDSTHVNNLLNIIPNSIALSNLNTNNTKQSKVLIIDCIGILMYLYKKCYIAYIGGGFGKGIHNILEAAVFYKPIGFGPNNKKFLEAQQLLHLKGATQIVSCKDFDIWVKTLLENESIYNQKANICGQFVEQNSGATLKIFQTIKEKL